MNSTAVDQRNRRLLVPANQSSVTLMTRITVFRRRMSC